MQATLGGIAVTPDGATSVSGLFAAGACANVGVRGAGELAGNPLMESVVFGRRAGTAAAAAAQQTRAGQASAALAAGRGAAYPGSGAARPRRRYGWQSAG